MQIHKIRRGLRLPIPGAPAPSLERARPGGQVALLGADFVGLKPTFHVHVGDRVRRGQVLFTDKASGGVRFTAPAAGRVAAIHRGPRRRFVSLVIALSEAEKAGDTASVDNVRLASFTGAPPAELPREAVVELLLESGEWTALRQRPFSRVADPTATPHSIFVTATDTEPLAPPIAAMLTGRESDLERGLHVLAKLTAGPVFVCTDGATQLSVPEGDRFRLERFEGPHPAGTVGLHIHRLDPVDRTRLVWHVGIQDVLSIGALFESGRLHPERIVSLAGPAIARPRLLRTRRGASIDALCEGELREGEVRVLSGSVLAGRRAMGAVDGFLGRYHQQIAAIHEQREREFLGWLHPAPRTFSAAPSLLSRLLRRSGHVSGSSTGGSPRAIVPIGLYEKVLPMDLEATFLLKAIMMRDAQWAEMLGCLELDEEDLALCSFVCPGKSEFGRHLREILDILAEEAA
jgi:Na+-transporting NADH:ubiquinone oxidoreductase subunit A